MTRLTPTNPNSSLPAQGLARPVACRGTMRTARWLCVGLGVLFLLGAWWSLGVNKSYPGDEARFIQSAHAFSSGISVALLRSYEEMSGPLPFVYWGQWQRAFGDSLVSMRLATMLWSVAGLWLLFEVLATLLPRPRWVVLAFGVVLINPYWWTMSIFAYTDIFAVVGLMLAWVGVARGRWWFTLAGVAIALLSRQYLVFALPALGLVAWSWMAVDKKRAITQMMALIVGCLPLTALVVLWHGLGPDNHLKATYETGLLHYKLTSAWLYICLMGLYGLPAWVWLRKAILPRPKERWVVLIALLIAVMLGFTLRIEPSPSAATAGYTTVGLLDRTLQWLHLSAFARQIIWSLGGLLGALLLARLGCMTWQTLKAQGRFTFQLAAAGGILLMLLGLLAVMPLSYLHWEKYIVPVLPWVIAGIISLRSPREIVGRSLIQSSRIR